MNKQIADEACKRFNKCTTDLGAASFYSGWNHCYFWFTSLKCSECNLWEQATQFCYCPEVGIHTDDDFCCKYWEPKEQK